MALSAISLFAGGGGLDLGLERAGIARTVCRVEHEAYACAVLAARAQDGSLDDAPIWSDVATFDGKPWRGVVDLVAGGFPCQDISSAGKGAGIIEGARSGLWREFARIIREVEPRYVFVENVSALIVRGLDVVLGDLAAMGFDAEWGVFRASDVGAPHRRERVFILAHREGRGQRVVAILGDPACGHAQDAPLAVRRLRPEQVERRGGRRDLGSHEWPPGPEDGPGWQAFLGRHPETQPAVRGSPPWMAHRTQRLRLLGNGVVPQQAALAWSVLMRRMIQT